VGKGHLVRALTHPSLPQRAVTAALIALGLWLAAWTVSYLTMGEGALRPVMAARVPDEVLRSSPSLATAIFSWNLVFGVGAIVLASLFALGPLSLGYLAPWWWALGYGVALGTNSFVLTVPGKIAPRIDILWQHIGAREILAYILVASALANVHLWRPRRWRDLKLTRLRAFADMRFGLLEAACLAAAVALLAWSANVEAAGVTAFLK
jgi:hypothetical protein